MEGDGEALGVGTDRDGDAVGLGEVVRPGVGVALGAGLDRCIAGGAGVTCLVAPVPPSNPPASTPPAMTAAAATAVKQLRMIRLRRRRSPSRMTSVAAFGCAVAAA
jgi:hypothetical protein